MNQSSFVDRPHAAMNLSKDQRRIALGVLAVAVVVAAFYPPHFWLDDPYITFHNARSLLAGRDPMYGENPLVGATSPVHLLSVALVGTVMPFPNAAMVISVLCLAAYVVGLSRWGWKVMVVGLTAGTASLHLFNGLESVMAMAAVTWAILLMDDRRLPFLAGAMPFIRPELGLLAALLLIRRTLLTRDWRPIVLAAAIAAPFVVWSFAATGHIVPNTVSAKLAFFRNEPTLSQRFTGLIRSANETLMTPLLLAAAFLPRRSGGWTLMVFLAGWLLSVFLTDPFALMINEGRYWMIAVPILCYALPGIAQLPMMAIAILGTVWIQVSVKPYDPWTPMSEAAAKLPAGATVLIHDAGHIAWSRPPIKLIDVVGLKSPRSTAIAQGHGARLCRWGASLDQIARESHADYLIALKSYPWGCIPRNLRKAEWRVIPTFDDPQGFTIYKIEPTRLGAVSERQRVETGRGSLR